LLEGLRQQVLEANLALPRYGLVAWTSGNVSGREPGSGLVAIKPSGVRYECLTLEDIALLDLEGTQIEGRLRPSVDAATHLYVYSNRSDVGGMVHTHSTYATAFAALGRPIEPCLTALADEFGGPIPVGDFAPIGGEEIGREIVRSIGDSPAILMRQHGVFTVGTSVEAALKAAVMVEDAARTLWVAMQIGAPQPLPPAVVQALHQAYRSNYGQR